MAFQSSFHRDIVMSFDQLAEKLYFQSSFHRVDPERGTYKAVVIRVFQSSFHRAFSSAILLFSSLINFQSSFHRVTIVESDVKKTLRTLSILFSSRFILSFSLPYSSLLFQSSFHRGVSEARDSVHISDFQSSFHRD